MTESQEIRIKALELAIGFKTDYPPHKIVEMAHEFEDFIFYLYDSLTDEELDLITLKRIQKAPEKSSVYVEVGKMSLGEAKNILKS